MNLYLKINRDHLIFIFFSKNLKYSTKNKPFFKNMQRASTYMMFIMLYKL